MRKQVKYAKQVCKTNNENFCMLQNWLKFFFTIMRNFSRKKIFSTMQFFSWFFKKYMQNKNLFFQMQMQKKQKFFVKNLLKYY